MARARRCSVELKRIGIHEIDYRNEICNDAGHYSHKNRGEESYRQEARFTTKAQRRSGTRPQKLGARHDAADHQADDDPEIISEHIYDQNKAQTHRQPQARGVPAGASAVDFWNCMDGVLDPGSRVLERKSQQP